MQAEKGSVGSEAEQVNGTKVCTNLTWDKRQR